MEVFIEDSGFLKKKLKVTVPAQTVDTAFRREYAQLQKKVKINGFRPGKVPMSVLSKRYGQHLSRDIGQSLVQEYAKKAIDEQGFKLAKQAEVSVEKQPEQNNAGFDFELNLILRPEVDPLPPEKLHLVEFSGEPEAADVERRVEHLLDEAVPLNPVEEEGVASAEDVVRVDYVGLLDGMPFEGSEQKDFRCRLSEKDTLFTEIKDALLGMRVGEQKVVTITYPDEEKYEKLQNKAVEYSISMKSIQRPDSSVALDEDFYTKSFGEAIKNREDLSQATQDMLLREMQNGHEQEQLGQLREQISEQLEFDLPEEIVEEHLEQARKQHNNRPPQNEGDTDLAPFDEEAERHNICKTLRFQYYIKSLLDADADLYPKDEEIQQRITQFCAFLKIDPQQLFSSEYGKILFDREVDQLAEQKVMLYVLQQVRNTKTSIQHDT